MMNRNRVPGRGMNAAERGRLMFERVAKVPAYLTPEGFEAPCFVYMNAPLCAKAWCV